MEKIESVNNKLVKYTYSLNSKKGRREEGKFIAEGERLVRDAMLVSEPEYIIITEKYGKTDFGVKTYMVTESVFKKISDTVNPQGVMGIFKKFDRNIADITLENTVILNGVSDPGNVGTILRTANAAGFSNVIIDNKSVDLYNPKTVRSSMSALFNLNIYESEELYEDIIYLKKKGFNIYGTALTEASEDLYKTEIKFPVAVVVGNEANGIDDEILDICDKKIIIPMEKTIESLNASVAASVVMYEVLRRCNYN